MPHPATSSLELLLKPLPAAQWFAHCHLFAMAIHIGHLAITGHRVMVVLLILLAVWIRSALRQLNPSGPTSPRLLILTHDGRLHVAQVNGQIVAVHLGGESLWLGSAALLVLKSPSHTWRLLLGPGNVRAPVLAALRRRLLGAATAAENAAETAVQFTGFPIHGKRSLVSNTRTGPV